MSMSLRVVVPPHPLIGHWLTLLRDAQTPPALFATGMAELGRWLTYEALRDWLPHQRVTVQTDLASTEGTVVDASVPVLVVPMLRGGLGLWQGGQTVLPVATVAHVAVQPTGSGDLFWALDALPAVIASRVGVLVYAPEIGDGRDLIAVLQRLQQRGVEGQRLRVISTLAARPGLSAIAEAFPDLTVYCACIDAELDPAGRLSPGIGDVVLRLFGSLGAAA
ncbi:uracil phosphoribosyltransferase [Synechococcus sp. CCY9201]|uniref:uracil phosphoribosyltransferase n=1 Tax=unclassified Synechococcus TaxID=2626047 RepID=UPI0018CEE461|nr:MULTISPECIES: uracil phosphoribosyltransferase [unclassified Synechococcus]MEA5422951.1 uracil phosphoribosyltransferase [Synechococcus sp. CCY9202]MEA5473169.1 uracil phosphoribosyltransferase [Synechococcus sp. CCY9201]QPN66183.1 uracil phosphoribosyltransferase [Synechococcus sp. CBW1006]CAK6695156.1 Uracil phosphoribosyltransferase [Synechococcus sp. CBW1107]